MFEAIIKYQAHFPSEGQSISGSNLTVQNFHQIPERGDLIRLDVKYKSRIAELEVERTLRCGLYTIATRNIKFCETERVLLFEA